MEQCQAEKERFISHEYLEGMPTILNMYQEIVSTRLDIIQSSAQKLIVFEIALSRGLQYEYENTFKVIETLGDVPLDTVQSSPISPEPVADHVHRSPTILAEQTQPPKATEPNTIEQKIIDSILSPNEIDIDLIESVREQTNTMNRRLSLISAIRYRLTDSVLPNPISLTNLGRVLWVILDACEVDGKSSPMIDSDCARKICAMARLYHASPRTSGDFISSTPARKKFLQSELYDHPIWNRVALWEESLIIVVSEELLGGVYACEMTVDTFGHYMLLFGLSPTSASNVCARVLKQFFQGVPHSFRLTERLVESIRVAQEKQNRHIAALGAPLVENSGVCT
jgi:hypothetical protein